MKDKGAKGQMIADEMIVNRIYVLRGMKVMIDDDLALLYQVRLLSITALLSKHAECFPEDFMFPLNQEEYHSLCHQDTTVSRPLKREALPVAFTEQGLAMLAGLMKGSRVIAINIRIIRIFTMIRQVLPDYPELSGEIARIQFSLSCRK